MQDQEDNHIVTKDVEEVMKSLQGVHAEGVIKSWKTWPLILVDKAGAKKIGFSVVVDVSPDCEYEGWVIDTWKEKLGADSWSVMTSRNRLQIKFNIITNGRTRSIKRN